MYGNSLNSLNLYFFIVDKPQHIMYGNCIYIVRSPYYGI